MLHYKNRRNQIHIFSLDRRLLDDIDERLADLRVNYSAMAFFGDPFLHYHEEELLTMTRERNFLPDRLSQRFEKYFKDETPSIDQLRRYFRAANREGDEKKTAKKERRRIQKKLVSKIILDEFPEDKELVRHALSKEGLSVPGESLTFNIYPFYFEERVLEALKLAQAASLDA